MKSGRRIVDEVAKASTAVARAPDVFWRTSRVLRWRPPWSRVDFPLFCARYFGLALDFSDRASINRVQTNNMQRAELGIKCAISFIGAGHF